MINVRTEGFFVAGISVRTSNEEGHAGKDIPALWQRFMSENIMASIPNKVDETIYSVYTEYEGDYTKPYTTILGCKVSSLEGLVAGLVGIEVKPGNFVRFVSSGNPAEGAVFAKWMEIWQTPLERLYTTDFEVYDDRSQRGDHSEVDILHCRAVRFLFECLHIQLKKPYAQR